MESLTSHFGSRTHANGSKEGGAAGVGETAGVGAVGRAGTEFTESEPLLKASLPPLLLGENEADDEEEGG